MASQRRRKAVIVELSRRRREAFAEKDLQLLDRSPPVGREFGSADFDRLMAEDHRNGAGVFDSVFKAQSPAAADV